MEVHQLIDQETYTYTYVLVDSDTRKAMIVDPVRDRWERDLTFIEENDLTLSMILETHVHADHVTGAGILRKKTGASILVGEKAAVPCADRQIKDKEIIALGNTNIEVRSTPGHTPGCISLFVDDLSNPMVFTGDALLISGCGRTDFQGGSSKDLFKSVHSQLWTLPDHTVVYPGHDYRGRLSSTVGAEKQCNPRLNTTVSLEHFEGLMANLSLPYPKRIRESLPANYGCGLNLESTSAVSLNRPDAS
jgi:glyoxylase-like metal-dependent hydrolase (beta-lactamase superfamily II)